MPYSRESIDLLLTAAGWQVVDAGKANILASRGVAIREFPLKSGHGFADDLHLCGWQSGRRHRGKESRGHAERRRAAVRSLRRRLAGRFHRGRNRFPSPTSPRVSKPASPIAWTRNPVPARASPSTNRKRWPIGCRMPVAAASRRWTAKPPAAAFTLATQRPTTAPAEEPSSTGSSACPCWPSKACGPPRSPPSRTWKSPSPRTSPAR